MAASKKPSFQLVDSGVDVRAFWQVWQHTRYDRLTLRVIGLPGHSEVARIYCVEGYSDFWPIETLEEALEICRENRYYQYARKSDDSRRHSSTHRVRRH